MSSQDDLNELIEQASATAASGGLVRLLRAPVSLVRAHPRVAIAVAATALLLTGSLVTGWWLYRSMRFDPESAAKAILETLDSGEFETAKQLAETLARRIDESPPSPVALYALGVATFQDARKASAAAQKALFLAAARWLEAALGAGLAEDRRGEAYWMLGQALYEAGEMSASQAALLEALRAQPHRAAEIQPLLIEAYLRDSPPKLAQALEQNKLFLTLEHLSAFERVTALIRQAEILLAMDQPKECLQTLAAFPSDSLRLPDVCVLRGRALLQEARALRGKKAADAPPRQFEEALQAAQASFRQAIESDPSLASAAARQAAYFAAVCLTEKGDAAGALARFGQLRSLKPGAPEYLAAAMREGELLQALQRDAEAADAYGRALDAVGDPKEFRNPWVSLAELGARVREMFRRLREAGNYPAAFELAQRAAKALPEDQAVEMKAEIHRDWGRDLLARAEKGETSTSPTLARDGREHLRHAARAWRRLAQLRAATRWYPEEVWQSARCAMEGRDFSLAVEMLQEYLKVAPRGRQPQALADLGEALLALGRIEEAVAALRECFQRHAKDMNAPRARLLASYAFQEKGDVAAAQQMLEANLSGNMLTPASREYAESLFALGRLLHQARRYDEALAPLEEAVQRYPDAPKTIEARYWIADCHRQKAQAEKERLRADLVELSRASRLRRIEEELNASLAGYRQAQKALLKREESGPLNPLEALMLRNSYFFIGSALMDLGKFDAAAEAYSQVVQRYPGAPETLEALVELGRAFLAVNKPAEARDAINQARFLLARMKPDALLQQTTNFSRSQWAVRLEQLAAHP
mgnify:CR=1 FL=1